MVAPLPPMETLTNSTPMVWPITAWVRHTRRHSPAAAGRAAPVRRLTRVAAVADLVYLAGWYAILAPILRIELSGYNEDLDGFIRLMQVAAIIPLLGAMLGVWNVWLALKSRQDWALRVPAIMVALALVGFLWSAWMAA